MARINIEDDLYKDRRFTNLILKLGSRHAALGALVEAWTLAQEFVTIENPAGRIPKWKWEEQEIRSEVLDAKLAILATDNYIEVDGALKQFAWLVQAQINGGKGGRPKSEPKPNQDEPKPNQGLRSGNPLPLPLPLPLPQSPDLAPSVPSDETPSASPPPKKKRLTKAEDPDVGIRRAAWEAYREAYAVRWNHDPHRNATVNSQIKALVERVGEDAPDLLRFYVGHNKAFYVEKGHPVGLAVTDYQGLLNQMRMNRQFTRADAQNLERQTANAQTLKSIQEEGI